MALQVWLAHPKLPSCEDCKAFMHDPNTWERLQRGGRDCPRPAGVATPCQVCPKLTPEDQRRDPRAENAREVTDRMVEAFWYYRLCREDPHALAYPRDALTIENNALCRDAEESASEASRGRRLAGAVYAAALAARSR